SVPTFIAFQQTGGTLLSTPQLVVPGSASRNVTDLSNLYLQSVPSLPFNTPTPPAPSLPSANVTLTGDVVNPGVDSRNDLAMLFPATQLTAGGDNYTGVKLSDFIKSNTADINDKIVVVRGTDGYQVVHALAELDPSAYDNPLNVPLNLLAYTDTGTQLD